VNDIKVKELPVKIEGITNPGVDTKYTDDELNTGIAPPIDIKRSSVIEVIPEIQNTDTTFIHVEIEASFKGDWNSYVTKQVEKNIDELTEAGESGTCIIQFIVSTDGTVSNVEALTMKGSKLAEDQRVP
jgi:outer membrane biosynthesis protein TonB